MNYVITSTRFGSPLLYSMKESGIAVYLSEEDLKFSSIRFHIADKIYSVAGESAIAEILAQTDSQHTIQVIDRLQNKYKFRQLIASLFPDFEFKSIPLNELHKETITPGKTLVVKPLKGFFAAAVRTVSHTSNLTKVQEEIQSELRHYLQFFPPSVISQTDLLLEDYIQGEEYAIDLFFSASGRPEIVNIYHHPMHQREEYIHTLYYSNYAIFTQLYDQAFEFFSKLNQILEARNLPVHAEFRLINGCLVPIEINPMRFGGFAIADLVKMAYGFNPYEKFFNDEPIDWQAIWSSRQKQNFAFVLGYNGKGLDIQHQIPNREQFLKRFSKVLKFYELDHKTNPAFGIAFIETSDYTELSQLLELEFSELFSANTNDPIHNSNEIFK